MSDQRNEAREVEARAPGKAGWVSAVLSDKLGRFNRFRQSGEEIGMELAKSFLYILLKNNEVMAAIIPKK